MRVPLVLVMVLLAGCASQSLPKDETRTPFPEPTPPPSGNATTVGRLLLADEPFQNATAHETRRFSAASGHWLCLLANVTATSGEAVVAVESPSGAWTTLATPEEPARDQMVPWEKGDFVAHLNLTAFTGRIVLDFTNEP